MNKTGISWADATLNPLPFCSRGCPYCYADTRSRARLKCSECRDNKPHFHPERLRDLRSKPFGRGVCFLNSIGDLFDPAARAQWLDEVWQAVEFSRWQVVALTKRPSLVTAEKVPYTWPENLWLGISAENQKALDERMNHLIWVENWPHYRNRIVSLEPLCGPIDITPWLGHLSWVIVGGLSGTWLPEGWRVKSSLVQAQGQWTKAIADQIHAHNKTALRPVSLWIKDDYGRLPSPAPLIQQHPPQMLGQAVPHVQQGLFG